MSWLAGFADWRRKGDMLDTIQMIRRSRSTGEGEAVCVGMAWPLFVQDIKNGSFIPPTFLERMPKPKVETLVTYTHNLSI